jgi:hypothetical protein
MFDEVRQIRRNAKRGLYDVPERAEEVKVCDSKT